MTAEVSPPVPDRPAQFYKQHVQTEIQIEMTDKGLGVDTWYTVDDLLPNWITIIMQPSIVSMNYRTGKIGETFAGSVQVILHGNRLGPQRGPLKIMYSSRPDQDGWSGHPVRPLSAMPGWLMDTAVNLGGAYVQVEIRNSLEQAEKAAEAKAAINRMCHCQQESIPDGSVEYIVDNVCHRRTVCDTSIC